MTKALAWTEQVHYIECPECGYTEALESVIFGNDKFTCGKCAREFEIDDQTDRVSKW